MRHFARILGSFCGGVFGMKTGVPAGGDVEDAFGLVALCDSVTDDLPIERAFEAIAIGFESFGQDCERYRTVPGTSVPCLHTSLSLMQRDVVEEMQRAQVAAELVDARFEQLLLERGPGAATPGRKRDADGNLAPRDDEDTTARTGAGGDSDKKLTKAQKERARKKDRLAKRLEAARNEGGGAGAVAGQGQPAVRPPVGAAATAATTGGGRGAGGGGRDGGGRGAGGGGRGGGGPP